VSEPATLGPATGDTQHGLGDHRAIQSGLDTRDDVHNDTDRIGRNI
jgi:hypothetical protein